MNKPLTLEVEQERERCLSLVRHLRVYLTDEIGGPRPEYYVLASVDELIEYIDNGFGL